MEANKLLSGAIGAGIGLVAFGALFTLMPPKLIETPSSSASPEPEALAAASSPSSEPSMAPADGVMAPAADESGESAGYPMEAEVTERIGDNTLYRDTPNGTPIAEGLYLYAASDDGMTTFRVKPSIRDNYDRMVAFQTAIHRTFASNIDLMSCEVHGDREKGVIVVAEGEERYMIMPRDDDDGLTIFVLKKM